MKKVLMVLVIIGLILTSCMPTSPQQGETKFKYNGVEVSFFTPDTLISNTILAKITPELMQKAKYNLKYPASFVPNNMNVSRVNEDRVEGLMEFMEFKFQEPITLSATLYYKGKNAFGMEGSESITLYFTEKGEYVGTVPKLEGF